MGDALAGVDGDQRPARVGEVGELADRVHGAEHVALVDDGEQLRRLGEQPRRDLHVEAALGGQPDEGEVEAGAVGGELPGDEIAVVLHEGEHDPVAGPEQLARVRGRHQVQRLGGVAGEHQAPGIGVDEGGDPAAGVLEELGRLIAEGVRAAVDVGVALPVVALDGVEHLHRLLRRRRGVEVHERPVADLPAQDREVGAHRLDVEVGLEREPAAGGRWHGDAHGTAVSSMATRRTPSTISILCTRTGS